MNNTDRPKLAILYRVIQNWRLPVFERISKEFNTKVFHGPDFKGTKVVNAKNVETIFHTKLFSLRLRLKGVLMPVSPFLFFNLIIFNPKIIVTEGASNLFNALSGFIYAKLFRKKYIYWTLGIIENKKQSKFRKFLGIFINFIEKRSDAIIVYSSFGAEYYLKKNLPREKIYVAVNVVDTEKRLKEISLLDKKDLYNKAHKNTKFNILFVGALTKVKKTDNLIRAFKRIEKEFPDQCKLTIVGAGEEKNFLENFSKELSIKRIEFTGNVIEGVNKYFLESDVFVMPGLGGLAVSDAMVHGIPVIATIADGCEKDLISSDNGIYDPDLDTERIYCHLKDLIQDPERLKSMKEMTKLRIENKYNINTYMDSIFLCLKNVLK